MPCAWGCGSGAAPCTSTSSAPRRAAREIARRLLTAGQYERVNIPLERNYRLDDYRSALTLREPGAQEARTRGDDLRERFLFAPATLGRDQKEAVAAEARARKGPLRLLS